MLTRIPGVGKRLAERLAVELKEKLDDLAAATQPASDASPRVKVPAMDDVLSALVNLGYARPASQKAIEVAIARDAETGGHFDSLFRAALQHIR
jgi:Holliday junction DNA helicase RuvA